MNTELVIILVAFVGGLLTDPKIRPTGKVMVALLWMVVVLPGFPFGLAYAVGYGLKMLKTTT